MSAPRTMSEADLKAARKYLRLFYEVVNRNTPGADADRAGALLAEIDRANAGKLLAVATMSGIVIAADEEHEAALQRIAVEILL